MKIFELRKFRLLSFNSWMDVTGSLNSVFIIIVKSMESANQVRNIPQTTQNLNTDIMWKILLIMIVGLPRYAAFLTFA